MPMQIYMCPNISVFQYGWISHADMALATPLPKAAANPHTQMNYYSYQVTSQYILLFIAN